MENKGKTPDEIPFDDEPETEAETAVEKAVESSLAIIEKALDPLKITITSMEIKTEENRAKSHEMRGDLKKVEKLIKEYTEDAIDPINNKVKRLKAGLKPFSDKVKELVGVIKEANQKYDTAKLLTEQKEKREAQEKLNKEQSVAAQKMVEANKKGEVTPPEALEKLQETVAVSPTEKRKTEKGTESNKLVKVWYILLLDDTEWDKKIRLPLDQVKGRSGPAVPYVMVDRVQIQSDFEKGEKLPHWIHVTERANSTFRG
jgi:hypothetical protein